MGSKLLYFAMGLAAAFGAGLLLTCGLLLWALVLAVFLIRSSGAGVGKTG